MGCDDGRNHGKPPANADRIQQNPVNGASSHNGNEVQSQQGRDHGRRVRADQRAAGAAEP
jgi:hypothetical protein